MKFNLKVWRQKNTTTPGKLVDYTIDNINADQSFLEMVDVLNDNL
ncbi:MAG: succinate dehydrogenase/fumarate reductase iron-sulfur subunit, partial [Azospira oryzae]